MNKKWISVLLVLPLAVVVAAVAPGTDGWRSPCACEKAKDIFGSIAGLPNREFWQPQSVETLTARMQSRYPKGTVVTVLEERIVLGLSRSASCQRATGNLTCQFWLEKKDEEERGYEVAFGVSPDGTVTTGAVKARIVHTTNRKKS